MAFIKSHQSRQNARYGPLRGIGFYLPLVGRSTGASRSGGGLSSTPGYSPHPPRSSSATPSPSRGGIKPCLIASPPEGAKACQRATSHSRGLAGHRAAASVAQIGQPHGAPLMRRYFNAHAAAPYLCSRSSEPCGRTAGLTRASQPRRQQVRTPEAGPLACARVRRSGFRPPSYARTSGAATPIPRSRRSAARVLWTRDGRVTGAALDPKEDDRGGHEGRAEHERAGDARGRQHAGFQAPPSSSRRRSG